MRKLHSMVGSNAQPKSPITLSATQLLLYLLSHSRILSFLYSRLPQLLPSLLFSHLAMGLRRLTRGVVPSEIHAWGTGPASSPSAQRGGQGSISGGGAITRCPIYPHAPCHGLNSGTCKESSMTPLFVYFFRYNLNACNLHTSHSYHTHTHVWASIYT